MWEGRRTGCVWGLLSVRLAGCGAAGAPGWPVSGPLDAGRVRTRRVVFEVVDPGRRRGPGLGPFVGVWCQGFAPAGRFRLPYFCGVAYSPCRQVMPGAPRLLWLRGAAAGVVAPPVCMHVLAGGFVACWPPMVLERP